MIYSGEFELDEIDFVLSMPYPESQTDNELITSQNNLLTLANDIIAAIEEKITGGEKLPPELVKSIYRQFLPYDDTRVDAWVDEALKAKERAETTITQDSIDNDPENLEITNNDTDNLVDKLDAIHNSSDMTVEEKVVARKRVIKEYKEKKNKLKSKILKEEIKANATWRKLEEKLGKVNLKEQVDDLIFENRQESLREGILSGRHYFSSKNKHIDFKAEDLREYDKNRLGKVKLSEGIKSDYEREEVVYKLELKQDKPIEIK
jgi:hypothetical protein